VGPRAGLDRCGKSRPHRDSIPGPNDSNVLISFTCHLLPYYTSFVTFTLWCGIPQVMRLEWYELHWPMSFQVCMHVRADQSILNTRVQCSSDQIEPCRPKICYYRDVIRPADSAFDNQA
jgi:hypothetical protein